MKEYRVLLVVLLLFCVAFVGFSGGNGEAATAAAPNGQFVDPLSPKSSRFGAQGIFANFLDPGSPRGLRSGTVEEQELVLKEMNGIGNGWLRWIGEYDILRAHIDRPEGYNFGPTDAYTEVAFQQNAAIIGYLSTSHEFGLPGFAVLEDREAYMDYVRATVERYDGDADLGLPESDPAYPRCDLNGDGEITNEEKAEWGRTHRISVWQTLKEPRSPYGGEGPFGPVFKAEDVIDILQASWEAIREVDPDTPILFATTAPLPAGGVDNMRRYFEEIMQAGGGRYFDIVGVDNFSGEYSAEEVVRAHREVLQSVGLDKSIWNIQYGAVAVEGVREVNPFGGSLETQAAWVVKGAVLSFAAGAEKAFYGDFLYVRDDADPRYWHNYGLLNHDGVHKRPGFLTYGLTISKIDRFATVQTVEDGVYRFDFPGKDSVFVLWSEDGQSSVVSLSEHVDTEQVLVTHIIDETGQTTPETEVVPASVIPVSMVPVFVEAVHE